MVAAVAALIDSDSRDWVASPLEPAGGASGFSRGKGYFRTAIRVRASTGFGTNAIQRAF
jgi:hypothetical protein